jgi:hypothetical protein
VEWAFDSFVSDVRHREFVLRSVFPRQFVRLRELCDGVADMIVFC